MNLCGPTREHKTGWDEFCLRGRVRTLADEHRATRSQDGLLVEGDVHAITRTLFDERGNKTLTEGSDGRFGPVGAVYHRKLVCSLDAQGRLAGWKSFADGESGVVQ